MKRILFIYAIFFIDSFAENFVQIFYPHLIFYNPDIPFNQVTIWNTCASFTKQFLYLIPLFLSTKRFRFLLDFDAIDRAILWVCFFFTFIDSMDWIWFQNLRQSGWDWYVFVIVNVILLTLKYVTCRSKNK